MSVGTKNLVVSADLRNGLGDFSSIVCFRALVVGVENILGRAAFGTLKGAGRERGWSLVKSLGKSGAGLDDARDLLDGALGATGTRLCNVEKVDVEDAGETVTIYLSETICSSDEPQGSDRKLTFTLGAIHGAVEELAGRKYDVQQIGSVLRGQDYDIVQLTAK